VVIDEPGKWRIAAWRAPARDPVPARRDQRGSLAPVRRSQWPRRIERVAEQLANRRVLPPDVVGVAVQLPDRIEERAGFGTAAQNHHAAVGRSAVANVMLDDAEQAVIRQFERDVLARVDDHQVAVEPDDDVVAVDELAHDRHLRP
jgi:hypothetical protein